MIMEDMMIYWIGLLIKEYGPEVKGSTATCYNPVTAGSYFAAWWWLKGSKTIKHTWQNSFKITSVFCERPHTSSIVQDPSAFLICIFIIKSCVNNMILKKKKMMRGFVFTDLSA